MTVQGLRGKKSKRGRYRAERWCLEEKGALCILLNAKQESRTARITRTRF